MSVMASSYSCVGPCTRLSDGLGLCVRAPLLTRTKRSHVRCHTSSPPGRLESKLPANGTTACTCQFALDERSNHTNTRACGFTHTFSNSFAEKEKRKMGENGRENETRIMCALTETLTEAFFLKVMKHFLSVRVRFSLLTFVFLFRSVSVRSGPGLSRGRGEEEEMDGIVRRNTFRSTVAWLVEQRAGRFCVVISGFAIKAGKCNYFKCSQQFCWRGGLPGFTSKCVGYWHSVKVSVLLQMCNESTPSLWHVASFGPHLKLCIFLFFLFLYL